MTSFFSGGNEDDDEVNDDDDMDNAEITRETARERLIYPRVKVRQGCVRRLRAG